MKNVFNFNKNVYKKDLRKTFFAFSLKRNPKLIIFIFSHIFNKMLNVFKIKNNEDFFKTYWKYLEKIDITKVSQKFWQKNNKYIDYSILDTNSIVVCDAPVEVIKPLSNIKFKGNKKNEWKNEITIILESYQNEKIYYSKYDKKLKNKNLFIKVGKKFYKYGKEYYKRVVLEYLKYGFIIAFLSVLLSLMSLYLSTGDFGFEMFKFYLSSKKIFVLNTVPIFILLCLFTCIFNSLGISFLFTSAIILIMTMVNYFKILFRNDAFVFLDLSLVGEAKEMLNTYSLDFPLIFFVFILMILILYVILKIYIRTKIDFPAVRITGVVFIILIGFLLYQKIYINKEVYNSLAIKTGINTNSATQNYITKGFMYPFIYSTTNKGIVPPENYNEKKAEEALKAYKNKNIEEDKKVHLISAMLESFSDLEELDKFEFTEDVYEEFHNLQEKSYHGNLLVSVFAGGTINTERKFLTGLTFEPAPRTNVNSYVRYFDSQGYITTGLHPGFSWFYNRVNVNEYMGFSSYRFWGDTDRTNISNKYKWSGFANDDYVFEDMIKSYEKAIKEDKYLFNFSVTYQNHGPQKLDYDGDTYFKKTSEFTDEAYNATNYYFDGIYKTNKAIKNLINYFETEKEPVVIILFGDHKPELGTDRLGFAGAGIDMDTSTEKGLKNVYTTPYIIWANRSAKERLNNDFEGDGPTISPNFLMNEFFKLADYEGNNYLQYTNNLEKKINVIQSDGFEEKGKFTRKLSNENQKLFDEFKQVEYYYYSKYNN